jgi:hypothetical protein
MEDRVVVVSVEVDVHRWEQTTPDNRGSRDYGNACHLSQTSQQGWNIPILGFRHSRQPRLTNYHVSSTPTGTERSPASQ